MNQVTQILSGLERGNPEAAERLLPLVYDALRKLAAQRLAQEKPGQTLQATALVHEAYLRLVDVEEPPRWQGRGHFFAAAAEAMRRILIEAARHRRSVKAGGGKRRVELDEIEKAGRLDDAAPLAARALEIDPSDPGFQKLVAELDEKRK
jgi:RNA polymerase sigma factor (TIGR02999 family)